MATGTSIKEKNKVKVREPKKYKVVMYNDDFTPMEFVVYILINIFKKSEEEAVQIMMSVHKGGKAVVGIYSYDIAKTKADIAISLSRQEGYPFRIKVEEV
ncbi:MULTISPECIES: ATP-dependent Clp protease adaptor ClpS [Clostridium]|uniref:ATP-dependent Clp protease adapter protein ClpS n=1 Tax=Clostridium cibarium TaxID=2762247 RepID=A0ABR8PX80_9CLOT|nr:MULTISPECIES: ATP-dependent Clp protease adaptor ClpS [Clostridium]MBD7912749.1 ATP-dependent Clp protease adaptor ClpS [Clostridium cibarium]